jgi:hypothetical protein
MRPLQEKRKTVEMLHVIHFFFMEKEIDIIKHNLIKIRQLKLNSRVE